MTFPQDSEWAGPTGPPPQEPTRPDVEARPDMRQPPAAPAGPGAYGPYGPPPMPPATVQKRNPLRTIGLIAVIVLFTAGGVAAGYFLVGDSGDEEPASIDTADESEAAEEDSEAPSEEPGEESSAEFSGETIPVESLGAQMPVPSDDWELAGEQGEDFADFLDGSSYSIQYEENWFANFMVGNYAAPELPYSAEEATNIASELADYWAGESAGAGENGTHTEPELTETTVDGRQAVIAESRASWDSTDLTPDTYERVIVVLIDVDGINAFYGLAFVPESAEDEYEALLAAFQAVDFED